MLEGNILPCTISRTVLRVLLEGVIQLATFACQRPDSDLIAPRSLFQGVAVIMSIISYKCCVCWQHAYRTYE